MFNKSLWKSERQDWKTPKDFFDRLDAEFEFDFDPCPPNPDFNGLEIEWGTTNFCNPPYNQIKKWLEKGFTEYLKHKTCVFLIPARTDTQWFASYCLLASEIRFVTGRLKFDNNTNSAPFPSMVVIFRKENLYNPSTDLPIFKTMANKLK